MLLDWIAMEALNVLLFFIELSTTDRHVSKLLVPSSKFSRWRFERVASFEVSTFSFSASNVCIGIPLRTLSAGMGGLGDLERERLLRNENDRRMKEFLLSLFPGAGDSWSSSEAASGIANVISGASKAAAVALDNSSSFGRGFDFLRNDARSEPPEGGFRTEKDRLKLLFLPPCFTPTSWRLRVDPC